MEERVGHFLLPETAWSHESCGSVAARCCAGVRMQQQSWKLYSLNEKSLVHIFQYNSDGLNACNERRKQIFCVMGTLLLLLQNTTPLLRFSPIKNTGSYEDCCWTRPNPYLAQHSVSTVANKMSMWDVCTGIHIASWPAAKKMQH